MKSLLVSFAAAGLVLGVSGTAYAGEVNGNGEDIPATTHASSECAFSGQDTADAVNKVVTAAVAVLVDLHNEKARSPATAPATTSPAETTPDDATANSQ